MDIEWISGYEKACKHALTVEWFVSPLEYNWGNGKSIADEAFRAPSQPHAVFDEMLAPQLFKRAANIPFRAQMMVFTIMQEPHAKTFGRDIEHGLLSLYGLDFRACMLMWIPVVEAYARKLFGTRKDSGIQTAHWKFPPSGDDMRDRALKAVRVSLGSYLNTIVFSPQRDRGTRTLNRNLVLHGNAENVGIYSQKNALILLFVLDALVYMEMVANHRWPRPINPDEEESKKIDLRTLVYLTTLQESLDEANSRKLTILGQHALSENTALHDTSLVMQPHEPYRPAEPSAPSAPESVT